jgi:hypothetical protein
MSAVGGADTEAPLAAGADTNGFPLEEPLLWCALNPDGYSHSAIRSAPIQESHRTHSILPGQAAGERLPLEDRRFDCWSTRRLAIQLCFDEP